VTKLIGDRRSFMHPPPTPPKKAPRKRTESQSLVLEKCLALVKRSIIFIRYNVRGYFLFS